MTSEFDFFAFCFLSLECPFPGWDSNHLPRVNLNPVFSDKQYGKLESVVFFTVPIYNFESYNVLYIVIIIFFSFLDCRLL